MVKEGVWYLGSITVPFLPVRSSNNSQKPWLPCAGAHDGRIQVTMNSGTAPYTWVLDGLFTPDRRGCYHYLRQRGGRFPFRLTATDINGCITTSPATIVVTAGPGFTASFTSTPTTCAGASNGKIQLAVQTPALRPLRLY